MQQSYDDNLLRSLTRDYNSEVQNPNPKSVGHHWSYHSGRLFLSVVLKLISEVEMLLEKGKNRFMDSVIWSK